MCIFCKIYQSYTTDKQGNDVNMMHKLVGSYMIFLSTLVFTAKYLLNSASHEAIQYFMWYPLIPQSTFWIKLDNSSNLKMIIIEFTVILVYQMKWQSPKARLTSQFLEPVNIAFFGKKVFANILIIKDLEMILTWIIWRNSKSNNICPYKKAEGDLRQREEENT